MPIRKIVKTLDAAFRDGARARQVHSTPQFRRDVQTDRRGTLRKFATVEQALQDRARIEKAKAAGEKAGPVAAHAPKATKAKAKKK